jgi:hypothetical protein
MSNTGSDSRSSNLALQPPNNEIIDNVKDEVGLFVKREMESLLKGSHLDITTLRQRLKWFTGLIIILCLALTGTFGWIMYHLGAEQQIANPTTQLQPQTSTTK